MEEDSEGNNAIHYAVVYDSCIGPLLDAIKNYHIHNCDINAFNNGKKIPNQKKYTYIHFINPDNKQT